MKIKRISSKASLLPCIVEFAEQLATGNDTIYSFSFEYEIAERVRQEMRAMAQKEAPHSSADELLHEATTRVTRRVEDAFKGRGHDVDVSKYMIEIEDKLAYPAKEIQALSVELARSKADRKLGEEMELVSDHGLRFVVRELGLREAIQGLLVEPADEIDEIDLIAVQEQLGITVEGESFPFEVTFDGFIFVIDDDGSIFVSTVNLPSEVRQGVNELIRRLADALYT